jgi:hypothetical protein
MKAMLAVAGYEVITAGMNSSIFWNIQREGGGGQNNENTNKSINKELELTVRLIIIWEEMRFEMCTQLWKDLTITIQDTIHRAVFYIRHYVSETGFCLRLRNVLF